MIKKLRIKFLLVALLSVFFVLASTIAAINISNYAMMENQASTALRSILNQGTQEFAPGGGPEREGGDIRQEHYFVVSFHDDGSVAAKNTKQMFLYTEEECVEMARKVQSGQWKGGRYGNLRYSSRAKEDGLLYVGFLDAKERMESAGDFLLLSSLISLGAYAVLALLIIFGSRIAFKPSEEAYKKQRRFITNASHELKTPLTVISADVDLIAMDHGESEWTDSIRDQVKRLTEMTNQLVTLSRLEEDPTQYPFEDFQLGEAAGKIAASFAPLFEAEGIQFSYHFASPLTMHGNRRLIEELISIFLDNSLKYTGGEKKSSYFTIAENGKQQIEFRFSNTLGKDDEVDVRQVMDRFYRSPSNKKEGSGIGLSIAEEIIALHKGKIQAKREGQTISFLIAFPA